MKDCKIVQDLLPSYIEKLTSKDTNEYVEEHLKNCEDCTSVYNDMKADLKLKSTTPKAEIDYMKKARKKMRIADKIALIVLILLIIFILLFWREIFSFICYADICNRYLAYQEEVLKTGKYTVYDSSSGDMTYIYCTPEMMLRKDINNDGTVWLRGILYKSDIEGSTIMYSESYNEETLETKSKLMAYLPIFNNESEDGMQVAPYYPEFKFNRKTTFWELMSTFTYIRNIRIVDNSYEIDFKDTNDRMYLDRGNAFRISGNNERKTLRVGEVSEEDIARVNLDDDNIQLSDFESPKRNKSEKITTKLSNCEKEAGTIVAYDFKILNEESSSLKYLNDVYTFDYNASDDNEIKTIDRLKVIKVTNNTTYKKLQERWSGLRDLTDEDFVNYSAIIVVDTDKTKEMHYKNSKYDSEIGFSDIYMTESEATSDYKYSATLIVMPNTLIYPTGNYQKLDGYEVHIVNN